MSTQNQKGTEGKRFVKPGTGRKPRHPELGRNIAKEGEWIIDSPRLRKFLRDGDVIEVNPPAQKKAVKSAKPTRKKGAKS